MSPFEMLVFAYGCNLGPDPLEMLPPIEMSDSITATVKLVHDGKPFFSQYLITL